MFAEIMARGIVKFPEGARTAIDRRWDDADNDPLFYLNLCGVPPIELFEILDDTESRRHKIKAMARAVIDLEISTEKKIAWLKKSKGKSSRSESKAKIQALRDELAVRHASVAKGLDLPAKHNPRNKRRVPLDNEFAFAVNQIVSGCYAEMTSMSWEDWREWEAKEIASGRKLDRRSAHRAHWLKSLLPAITGLMRAAWPDWFQSDLPENSLRKVKACWPKRMLSRKRKIKILIPDYPSSFSIDNSVNFIIDMVKHEPLIR